MQTHEIVKKLIKDTAERRYWWERYDNNKINFHSTFFENSQHFISSISYVLPVERGVFLLASFQAKMFPVGIAEEILLIFYKDNNEKNEERISENSSDLYALRKLVELNLSDIVPNLDKSDSSDQINDPSKELSDFLDS